MNHADAMKILHTESEKYSRSAEEDFRLIEAIEYLIHTTKETQYMSYLAWIYCGKKRFDLREKYLEMAMMHGDENACCSLGYIYYYGQAGVQDAEKAFHYFSKGITAKNKATRVCCTYKVADMYHYGMYVKQDDRKYKELIESAYEEVKNPEYYNEPYADITYRLAGIRETEGKVEEAVSLYDSAKEFLAEQLSIEFFWGDIEVMKRIVLRRYTAGAFDMENCDLYDLIYLLQRPNEVSFDYRKRRFHIKSVAEEEEMTIRFDGNCYRNIESFYEKAKINGHKLTAISEDLYNFKEVVA